MELPTTGCNILNNSTSFYNYSTDRRTRQTWNIYEGVAHKTAETTSQYGYDYSGTCLETGDLVFKPELKVWFPIVSFLMFVSICIFVFRLFRGRV